MSLHREIHLEDELCADLTAAGWLYDPADAGRRAPVRARQPARSARPSVTHGAPGAATSGAPRAGGPP